MVTTQLLEQLHIGVNRAGTFLLLSVFKVAEEAFYEKYEHFLFPL